MMESIPDFISYTTAETFYAFKRLFNSVCLFKYLDSVLSANKPCYHSLPFTYLEQPNDTTVGNILLHYMTQG